MLSDEAQSTTFSSNVVIISYLMNCKERMQLIISIAIKLCALISGRINKYIFTEMREIFFILNCNMRQLFNHTVILLKLKTKIIACNFFFVSIQTDSLIVFGMTI